MTPESITAVAALSTAVAEAEIAWRGRDYEMQSAHTLMASKAEGLLAEDVRLGEAGARAVRAALVFAAARTRGVPVAENPLWSQRDWAPDENGAYDFIQGRVLEGN